MFTNNTTAPTVEATVKALTVSTREFRCLLSRVRHFASTDEWLPSLRVVHLAGSEGRLVATATDRYSAARDHVNAVGELPPCLLGIDAAARIRKLLKPGALEEGEDIVELTVLGNSLIVCVGQSRVTARLEDGNFPIESIDKTLGRWTDERSSEGVALSGENLTKVTKAAGRMQSVRFWHYGPKEPVHVKVGPTFHAALMPVTLDHRTPGESLDIPIAATV